MTRAVEDVLTRSAPTRRPGARLAKADQLDPMSGAPSWLIATRDAVLVSAATGEGIDELSTRIETEFERRLSEVELLVPYVEGGRLAELHDLAGDLEREDTPDGRARPAPGCRPAWPRAISAVRASASGPSRHEPAGRAAAIARARLPTRAHPGDAGFDLYASTARRSRPASGRRPQPGSRSRFPHGHAGLVLPRSGLAARHGIALVNAPGLIDAGYRGELRVLLLNTDRSSASSWPPGTASPSSLSCGARRRGRGGGGAGRVGAGRGRLRLHRRRRRPSGYGSRAAEQAVVCRNCLATAAGSWSAISTAELSWRITGSSGAR